MKNLAVSVMVAFAFCVAAAVAQTGTDPSQATPGSSPSASQPATPSPQQPGYNQPDAAAGQAGQTNNSAAPAEKAEKKLRGCVQSQGGKYVLEGKKGKAVALTGQDVSAHVGHEVSLQGRWENGAGTGVSSGGASSEKTFNVTGVDMISETCGSKSSKGNSGSMGTAPSGASPGSSNPTGTAPTSNPPQ
jgi:hypothetical protein